MRKIILREKVYFEKKNLSLLYSVVFFGEEKEFNTSITLRFAAKLSIAAKARL